MDLNIAIARIYSDAKYRLSKANPPHEIIEWRDKRKQPTQTELNTVWQAYQQEESEKESLKSDIKQNGTPYYLLFKEEIRTVILLKKGLEVTTP